MKKKSTKETRQAEHNRFLWHLNLPFKSEFDRTLWWEKTPETKVEPVAALYELMRRHPMVGELRKKFHSASWYGIELRPKLVGAARIEMLKHFITDAYDLPNTNKVLCTIGLKCWANLTSEQRIEWSRVAGKIKGVESRETYGLCMPLTELAWSQLRAERAVNIAPPDKKVSSKAIMANAEEDIKLHPFTKDDYNAAIARLAVYAHDMGYLIYAIAEDSKIDDVVSALKKQFSHYQTLFKIPQNRAPCQSWLDRISALEGGKIKVQESKSQTFARYCRIFKDV